MEREKYLKAIIQKLSTLSFRVGLSASVGFTDINVSSEDFFKDLLNLLYGWDLKNLNVGRSNTPAVDLGDVDKKIFVQVTSEKRRQKVIETLDGFRKLQLKKDYAKIVMLLLREKPDFRRFTTAETDGVDLEIMDPFDVIKEVKNRPLLEIKAIKDFLDASVSSAESDGEGLDRHFTLDFAKHLLNEHKPDAASDLLEKMRLESWARMASHEKYRVTSLLAGAHIAKGQYLEAGRFLVEGRKHNPTDERAQGNCAVGFLVVGQEAEAIKLANAILTANPLDGLANSVLIRAAEDVAAIDRILSSLPPDFVAQDNDIQRALYAKFSTFDEVDRAISAAEAQLKNESDRSCDSIANLASEILAKCSRVPGLPIAGRSADPIVIADLQKALSLFDEAIGKVADREIEKYRLFLYVNRSSVRFLLGLTDKAIEDLEYVVRKDPTHRDARKKLGMVCSRNEADLGTAIECLEPFATDLSDLQGTTMLAGFLALAHRHDESIALLKKVEASGDPEYVFEAKFIRTDVLIIGGQFEEAEQVLKSFDADTRSRVAWTYLRAKSFRLQSKLAEAVEALNALDSDEVIRIGDGVLYKVAGEAYHCNLYQLAEPLFRHLVAGNPHHPYALPWLECLYMSGKYEEALRVCPLMAAAHPREYMPVQVQMAIHESTGDLGPARKACKEFLDRRPDAEFARVDLAQLEWRSGNLSGVDRVLDEGRPWSGISVTKAVMLANMLSARGRRFEAIEMLYRVRRDHADDAKAHSLYFQFFVMSGDKADSRLSPEKVAKDCWVHVELSDGSNTSFVIEDLARDALKSGERNLTNDLVRLVLGKAVGESFDVRRTAIQRVTGKVVDLKSKYVHAFHECGEQFSVAFPTEDAIVKMTVPTELRSVEDFPEEFHNAMELKAKERDRVQEVLRLYKDRRATIGAVAEVLGIHALEALDLLISEGVGIQCSRGVRDEVVAAIRLCSSTKPLVIDLSVIYTWSVLGIRDVVEEMFDGRLCTGQSTIDAIASLHHEKAMHGTKERLTISKVDNVYYREVVTADRMEKGLAYLADTLAWVRDKVAVKPRRAAITNSERVKKLDEVLGREFSECLHIAKECDGFLVSDDEHLRDLAKGEVGVGGAWSKIILDMALIRGLVTKDQYHEKVVDLIEMRYGFLEFGADTLMAAMRKEGFRITKKLEEATKFLDGSMSEVRGAVHTLVECLFLFWKDSVATLNETTLASHLMECIVKHRNAAKTVDLVKLAIAKKFELLPIDAKRWLDFVEAWCASRTIEIRS